MDNKESKVIVPTELMNKMVAVIDVVLGGGGNGNAVKKTAQGVRDYIDNNGFDYYEPSKESSDKFLALLNAMSDDNKAEFFHHISAAYNMLEEQFGATDFKEWLRHFCDDSAIVSLFAINNIASSVYWGSARKAESNQ